MPTLGDLISSQTREQVLATILSLFRLAGFPVASWQATSLPRYLTSYLATHLADLSTLIALIAKGGYLDHAEDTWLDLLAASLFAEQRKPPLATRGVVRLRDASLQGPISLPAGTVWIATANRTRRFRNVADAELPLGGDIEVLFEAESAGADWNVGSGEITELLTPGGTGVLVANGPGTAGTWIRQQGADRESDPALRQRCRDKWATIGSGSTDAAYRYWATSSSPEVTRVRVDGDPDTGRVTVIVAGPTGPISDEALGVVVRTVATKRPLTVRASVTNVAAQAVQIEGTLFLDASANAAATLDAAAAAVVSYARESEIGGTVYLARIVGAMMVPGTRNVTLTLPANDIALAQDRVFAPSFAVRTLAT